MANIQPYTDQIRTARYGEQVRGSIVNALEAMNDDINDDTQSAGAYAQQAETSAQNAAQTASNLSSTLTRIETDMEAYDAAEQSRDTAEQERATAEAARKTAEQEREDVESGYVAQARTYAQQAAQHASSDNAILSQSWAVGGTSTRYGEDTNNAKYYADLAAEVVTEGGVASFNGRTGNVLPESGDYDSDSIVHGSGTVNSALQSIGTNLSDMQSALNSKADRAGSANITVDKSSKSSAEGAKVSVIGKTNSGATDEIGFFASSGGACGVRNFTDGTWLIFDNNGVPDIPNLRLSSATSVSPDISDTNLSGRCYLKRLGKLCFISMYISYSSGSNTLPSGESLFTIPEAYRPAETQYLSCFMSRGSYQSIGGILQILADGSVQQTASGAATGIYAYGVYEIA